MKVYLALTAVLVAVLILLPLSFTGLRGNGNEKKSETSFELSFDEETTTPQSKQTEKKDEKQAADKTINVFRTASSSVETMKVRDYLVGAVASEISPLYEKEAIKAQVVACYTYAKWLGENADKTQIGSADISDSSDTHQGYFDKKQLKEKWGDKYDSYLEKIEECVDSVLGQFMTFDSKPILACYHSLSGGKTESAEVVWGKKIEYLKSVDAPGDRLSPDFDSTVTLGKDEFKKKCENLEGVSLGGEASKWIGKIQKSEAGFVKNIVIGSKSFDGNEIRSAFSLKSPYFSLSFKEGKFVFDVVGYGHGLGMSQYSADYMARQGSTYDKILRHFYSGIELEHEDV